MKLSSKGRYGVRAVFDMAFHNADAPTQIKDIARRQAIPPRFLEQIFQDLRRAAIITSRRGPRGGYRLARAASDIGIGDIVRALDGPIGIFDADERPRAKTHSRDSRRVTDEVFVALARDVEACFDRITIADIVRKAEAMGVSRDGTTRPYTYAI
jgi:Rrf2 family protein